MRRSRPLAIAVLFLLLLSSPPQLASAQDTVTIGIVQDGPGRGQIGKQVILDEIQGLLSGEFDVRIPESKTIVTNWDTDGIRSAIDQQMRDPEVDLVLSIGVLSSNALATFGRYDKPAIAPYVISARIQNIPQVSGTSGVNNMTYVTYPNDFRRDFKSFQEIVPFDRLVILGDRLNVENIPDLPETVKATSIQFGIDLSFVPCDDQAQPVLDALPDDAQAVYVAPLLRFSDEEFDALVQGLIDKKLPSFSLLGRAEVERGIMAALAPATDFTRIGRRVAVSIQRILLGENAADLPVTLDLRENPSVNMATSRAIGIYPSFAFLTDAERINDQRTTTRRSLSLREAVDEAVEVNLNIAAAAREVAARGQDVREARSFLLPQIDLSTDARVIDQDRAAIGFGNSPERLWTGSATLNQLIFSEDAWANLAIQSHFRDATQQTREQTRLDITRDASVTYLDVLRAKTLEGIQKDNLRLSRTNLTLAEVRVRVGFASRAEVFRWESAIATARADVIDASATRNQAEIELNRILARPLEEPFSTVETGLTDTSFVTSDPRTQRFIGDPLSFRAFRAFLVQEAFDQSPELRELNDLIAAQDRLLAASKRSFFLPDVALQGDVTSRLAEGGDGTRSEARDDPDNFLPIPDDIDWFVGVSAQIPLFTSGARPADVSRAREELAILKIQRAAVQDQIEAGVRQAMHAAGASYAGIQLAQDAADAANQNLELVTDSYTRGAVSIIELLDAQNSALVARLGAANAVYDFFIDLMNVERASGEFYFFTPADEREDFFERANAFIDSPPDDLYGR